MNLIWRRPFCLLNCQTKITVTCTAYRIAEATQWHDKHEFGNSSVFSFTIYGIFNIHLALLGHSLNLTPLNS